MLDALDDPSPRRPVAGVLLYLLVAFGLAWAIELGPVRTLTYAPGKPSVMLWLVGVMFTPSVAAVAARLVEKRGFADARLRWGRGRYHLVAWLLPFLLGVVSYLVTVAIGAGQADMSGRALLERLPEPERMAAEAQAGVFGPWLPLIAMLSALTSGVLITSVAAFGEEFGWRGYLQPRLSHLGKVPAMALVGLIWGLWHAPIIMQGHNYPGYPVEGVFLMCLLCVVLGLIFGWLFEAAGSVLAPSIAHGSLNSAGAAPLAFLRGADPTVGGITGIVGIGVMAAFVVWLWATGRIEGQPARAATPLGSTDTGGDAS